MSDNKFEEHEAYDWETLERLRITMELDTCIPSTIYTFADIRLRRYQSELQKCKVALEAAKASLEEIHVNAEDFDFGPAYGGTVQRQKHALLEIKRALKSFKE